MTLNDDPQRPVGQVNVTPEGGPVNEGAPSSSPGAGQVHLTPEAGPVNADELLVPPTWHEHMQGPILGLDDAPASASPPMSDSSPREEPMRAESDAVPAPASPATRTAEDNKELSKWPPYRGKPVTDVSEVLRYAAPVMAQAEKLAIRALDLSGRGLTRLARFLQERRDERDAAGTGDERDSL